MENRHLIAKQVFELRVSLAQGNVSDLQNSFSKQFWQSIFPAIEQLFDRLIAPDTLVRIDRLELDLGLWSREAFLSGRFVERLLTQLESRISNAIQEKPPGMQVQSLSEGSFNLWLHFLKHGTLPAAASRPQSQALWQRQVLDTLLANTTALEGLRKLLSANPTVRERLILQYDKAFLLPLVELLSGQKQNDLVQLTDDIVDQVLRSASALSAHLYEGGGNASSAIKGIVETLYFVVADLVNLPANRQPALRERIEQALRLNALSPVALAQWLIQADSWKSILREFSEPEMGHDALSVDIVEALLARSGLADIAKDPPELGSVSRKTIRLLEKIVWRTLIDALIAHGRKIDTYSLIAQVIHAEALRPWCAQVLKAPNKNASHSSPWGLVAESFKAQTRLRKPSAKGNTFAEKETAYRNISQSTEQQAQAADADKSEVYYIQDAGVILFHPFLQRFFSKLGLWQKGSFIDEACRQKAVCLVHHLATGELRTPEYRLILPKFLCGMPLNAPLDHFIEIETAAQTESENLINAAVDHWGALGKSSPAWLREMFLQREGKMEKRESGWSLVVERKTQDVMLEKLPEGWGFGVIKLPWMEEVLRVDW